MKFSTRGRRAFYGLFANRSSVNFLDPPAKSSLTVSVRCDRTIPREYYLSSSLDRSPEATLVIRVIFQVQAADPFEKFENAFRKAIRARRCRMMDACV